MNTHKNTDLNALPSTVLQEIPAGESLSVHNPHDAFFQAIMTNLNKARKFFEVYLPERFKSHCDLSTLALQNDSFVEANLRRHLSDILYSVRIKGETGYIYCLVEHVTQAKPTTAFQVLRYQIAAMHQRMKQGAKKPPVVIPIVFYRGETSPYPESCDPFECFEDPQLARETLLAPHVLVDLSVIPDEELRTHKGIALMELLEKHISIRDLLDLVKFLADPVLREDLTTDEFKSLLYYLAEAGDSRDYQAFFEKFNREVHQPGDKTIMQKLGEYFTQRGVQQGMYRMNRENAKNMRLKGFSTQTISEITGLNQADIEGLK